MITCEKVFRDPSRGDSVCGLVARYRLQARKGLILLTWQSFFACEQHRWRLAEDLDRAGWEVRHVMIPYDGRRPR